MSSLTTSAGHHGPPPLRPLWDRDAVEAMDGGAPGSPGVAYGLTSSHLIARRVDKLEHLQALSGIRARDSWMMLYSETEARTFEYAKPTIRVGRDSTTDFCLNSESISRMHCEITMEVHVVRQSRRALGSVIDTHGGDTSSTPATTTTTTTQPSMEGSRGRGRRRVIVPATHNIQSPVVPHPSRAFGGRESTADAMNEARAGERKGTPALDAAALRTEVVSSDSGSSSSPIFSDADLEDSSPGTVVVRVYITDWSSNGTYVNDVRVPRGQRCELRTGDTIGLVRLPGHTHSVDSTPKTLLASPERKRPTYPLSPSLQASPEHVVPDDERTSPASGSAAQAAHGGASPHHLRNEEDSEDDKGTSHRHSGRAYEYAATLAVHLYMPRPQNGVLSPFTTAMTATPSSLVPPLSLPAPSSDEGHAAPQCAPDEEALDEDTAHVGGGTGKDSADPRSRRAPLCQVYMAGALPSTEDPDSLAGIIISPRSAAILREITTTAATTTAGGADGSGEMTSHALSMTGATPVMLPPPLPHRQALAWTADAPHATDLHTVPSQETILATPVMGMDSWEIPPLTQQPTAGPAESGLATPLPAPLGRSHAQMMSTTPSAATQPASLGASPGMLSPPIVIPSADDHFDQMTALHMPASTRQEPEEANEARVGGEVTGHAVPASGTARDGGTREEEAGGASASSVDEDGVQDAVPLGPVPRLARKRRLSASTSLSRAGRATFGDYVALLDKSDSAFIVPARQHTASVSGATAVGSFGSGEEDHLLLTPHHSAGTLTRFTTPNTFAADDTLNRSLVATPLSVPASAVSSTATAAGGVAQYRVLPTRKIQWGQRIGAGASGDVYCGIDVATSLMVAIKVLKETNGMPFLSRAERGHPTTSSTGRGEQGRRGRGSGAGGDSPDRTPVQHDEAKSNENTLLTMSDVSLGCHSPLQTISPRPEAGAVYDEERGCGQESFPRGSSRDHHTLGRALVSPEKEMQAPQGDHDTRIAVAAEEDEDDVSQTCLPRQFTRPFAEDNDKDEDDVRGDERSASATASAPPPIPAMHRSHLRELYALTKLHHRRIVRCLGFQHVEHKGLCIFMEYVGGGSLQALIRTFGAFHENLIRLYSIQILEGLEYLTKMRVVHGDLKSANVLVSERGEVKLTDFGTTRIRRQAAENAEGSNSVHRVDDVVDELLGTQDAAHGATLCGTPLYMSPELIRTQVTTTASDVWAFGCIVFEMATGGVLPWREVRDASPLEVIYYIGQHVEEGPSFNDIYQCRAALAAEEEAELAQKRRKESAKRRAGRSQGNTQDGGDNQPDSGDGSRRGSWSDSASTPHSVTPRGRYAPTPRISPLSSVSAPGEGPLMGMPSVPSSPQDARGDGSGGSRSMAHRESFTCADTDPHPDAHRVTRRDEEGGLSVDHREADADVEVRYTDVVTPTPLFMDFLASMFAMDADVRPTPTELLQHPFITGTAPAAAEAAVLRWHNALHARVEAAKLSHRLRGDRSSSASMKAVNATAPPAAITASAHASQRSVEPTRTALGVASALDVPRQPPRSFPSQPLSGHLLPSSVSRVKASVDEVDAQDSVSPPPNLAHLSQMHPEGEDPAELAHPTAEGDEPAHHTYHDQPSPEPHSQPLIPAPPRAGESGVSPLAATAGTFRLSPFVSSFTPQTSRAALADGTRPHSPPDVVGVASDATPENAVDKSLVSAASHEGGGRGGGGRRASQSASLRGRGRREGVPPASSVLGAHAEMPSSQPPPSYSTAMTKPHWGQRPGVVRRGAGGGGGRGGGGVTGAATQPLPLASVAVGGVAKMSDHRNFLRENERYRRSQQEAARPSTAASPQQQQQHKARRTAATHGDVSGGAASQPVGANHRRYGTNSHAYFQPGSNSQAMAFPAQQPMWASGCGGPPGAYAPQQPVTVMSMAYDPNASAASTAFMNFHRMPAMPAPAPATVAPVVMVPMVGSSMPATVPAVPAAPPIATTTAAAAAHSGLTTIFSGMQLSGMGGGPARGGEGAGPASAGAPFYHPRPNNLAQGTQPSSPQRLRHRGRERGAASSSVLGAAPKPELDANRASAASGLTMDFSGIHLYPHQPPMSAQSPPSLSHVSPTPSTAPAPFPASAPPLVSPVGPHATSGAASSSPVEDHSSVLGARPSRRGTAAAAAARRLTGQVARRRHVRGVLGDGPARLRLTSTSRRRSRQGTTRATEEPPQPSPSSGTATARAHPDSGGGGDSTVSQTPNDAGAAPLPYRDRGEAKQVSADSRGRGRRSRLSAKRHMTSHGVKKTTKQVRNAAAAAAAAAVAAAVAPVSQESRPKQLAEQRASRKAKSRAAPSRKDPKDQ